MIFVVIAAMVKHDAFDNRVRASCLTVLNATSARDAKRQFLESADVVKHIQENWQLGPVDALHLAPEELSQDVDTANYLRAELAKLTDEPTAPGDQSNAA